SAPWARPRAGGGCCARAREHERRAGKGPRGGRIHRRARRAGPRRRGGADPPGEASHRSRDQRGEGARPRLRGDGAHPARTRD
ncbi:MAG: hypothetical protein M3301_04270, partial [Chloroflexota bacterium]|nr:hypothetical protein [Chloroflexota bacterium]